MLRKTGICSRESLASCVHRRPPPSESEHENEHTTTTARYSFTYSLSSTIIVPRTPHPSATMSIPPVRAVYSRVGGALGVVIWTGLPPPARTVLGHFVTATSTTPIGLLHPDNSADSSTVSVRPSQGIPVQPPQDRRGTKGPPGWNLPLGGHRACCCPHCLPPGCPTDSDVQFTMSYFLLIDAATVSKHARPPPDAPYDTVPVHITFVDWIPAICSTRACAVVLGSYADADSAPSGLPCDCPS